jgi:hypothetical protein
VKLGLLRSACAPRWIASGTTRLKPLPVNLCLFFVEKTATHPAAKFSRGMATPLRFFTLCLLALAASAADAALPSGYTVRFEHPTYTAEARKRCIAKLIISPPPPAGLFSSGVTVTLVGGTATGNVITVAIPPALDFHTVRGTGATRINSGRVATAKGSVDFDTFPLRPYRSPLLGTFSLVGLPHGTYQLVVTPKIDLGGTEQLFVDGEGNVLDEGMRFVASQVIVGKALPLTGPILLNRQTGLFEQVFRLTNDSDVDVSRQRLYVDLPKKISLWNAWNLRTDPKGRKYIVYNGTLAPAQTINLTLEYNVPGRRLFGILRPKFSLGGAGLDFAPRPRGKVLGTTSGRRLPTGNVLLQFKGVKGAEYFIQYSSNRRTWTTVMPSLIGTGGFQQWLDNGPPKTASKPLPSTPRIYRIVGAK